MDIIINGKSQIIAEDLTVEQLLSNQNFNKNHVVVEVNGTIVRREEYGIRHLEKGDIVEILRFVGGG